MDYGIRKELKCTFTEAIDRVTAALVEEGFGVLTTIDVKATLKKKLGVEFGNYVILGACNPGFAHEALQAEQEIGLLLPCNVIVYEKGDVVVASAMRPTSGMGMIENDAVTKIAVQVEERLKRVIAKV